MVDKTLKVKDAHVESVKKAYEKGIQIALGTDAGTPFNYHSNTAYEMELLARLDISNMDILGIRPRSIPQDVLELKRTMVRLKLVNRLI